jgi:hypothetical protein
MGDKRERIQPSDWPDEEGRGEAQKSLRSDIGASLGEPKALVEDEPATPGPQTPGNPPAGRGKLGTHTPGSRGAEQGPR